MRKGDERRQELLAAAQRLFCMKGYEATSVQDILDVLHISKGGFYHHFASKEALLETLFFQRASAMLGETEASLSLLEAPMDRINRLLYGCLPLRAEEADFTAMLLPILEKPEGRALRLCYQEALHSAFLPSMEREIALAREDEVVFPVCPDLADVILHMLAQCWVDMAGLITACMKKAQRPEAFALLGILDKYRCCIQRLLDAPYGSVEIISLEEWDRTVEAIFSRITV